MEDVNPHKDLLDKMRLAYVEFKRGNSDAAVALLEECLAVVKPSKAVKAK